MKILSFISQLKDKEIVCIHLRKIKEIEENRVRQ
jgi:hypothetical protein